MKIYNNGRVKTCGECCVHNVPLWCIEFKGADGPIFLCAKCLLALGSIVSPLSILIQTGEGIIEDPLDSFDLKF